MSYYILIRGPLGIGKSTTARRISSLLNAEYVSIDNVLEENKLDEIVGESIPLKNFLKANEIMLHELKKKLSSGKVIVFDGNFYFREQIEDLIKQMPGKHFVFSLNASLETCMERDKNRENPLGEVPVREVYALVKRVEYGIPIDTDNKTQEEVVNEIMKHLKLF